ncbi:DUF393 domain-containing protein [Antrihabitans sp. YC3-6]|uniref:DUF393 domain-containing protein n=1 Tax=Antrihabitans stalagmiti TaxID=2799499 RepID=A0A934NSE5_9NOCA|nr:DUF393 domain-containing protein [Antrihabitans stalagmiti]MBJ8340633.1 DUF393 domain-containing protein [Antrihabitans stalagmiti]
MPEVAARTYAAEFLYDRDCGFCMKCLGVLHRIDRRDRVRTLALQDPGAPEHFGVTEEQAYDRAWAHDARGELYSGAGAINAALSGVLGTRIPLYVYKIPGIRWLQDTAYRWVAANRYRLPGKGGSCAVEPS